MAQYALVTAAVATAASVSDPVQVFEFGRVSLQVATFAGYCESAGCSVRVEGSSTSTTSTFLPLHHQGVYSAGSGILAWEVPQGNGGYIAVCEPASWVKWIRVRLQTNTTTAALGIGVHIYRP